MSKIVDEICALIQKYTENGLRVGQVMDNVFGEVAKSGHDPFYISDERLLSELRSYGGADDE